MSADYVEHERRSETRVRLRTTGGTTVTVSLPDVREARERIEGVERLRETPVRQSPTLGETVGADVWLKLEHFQKTGSFKPRGAYNKISQDVASGVSEFVAASAGNHAQGVALAATRCGADSTIYIDRKSVV